MPNTSAIHSNQNAIIKWKKPSKEQKSNPGGKNTEMVPKYGLPDFFCPKKRLPLKFSIHDVYVRNWTEHVHVPQIIPQVWLLAGGLLVILYGLFYEMSSVFLIHSSKISAHSKSLNKLLRNCLGNKYLAIYSAMFFVNMFSCLVAQNLTISEILYNNFGQMFF